MKNVFIGGGAITVVFSIIGGLADVGKVTRNIDRVSTISDSSRVIDTTNDTGEIGSTVNKVQQVIEPLQKAEEVYSTADSLSKFENSNSCNKDSNQQPTNQEC